MKRIFILSLSLIIHLSLKAGLLPGFRLSCQGNEQQMIIENPETGTRILINAPISGFDPGDRVLLVIYALPNGNTIEQTFGKKMEEGDDWHFDIQHIGAQTRYLRSVIEDRTIVVAYMENNLHSWPAWKAARSDYAPLVRSMVEEVKAMFIKWSPELVLNGHSGGGRFIFSYLEAYKEIPDDVVRIAFLDSDYGWDNDEQGHRLVSWLKSGRERYLCTLAYNDSVVVYNGKPLVSPTGGTWYRSKLMKDYLAHSFRLRENKQDTLIWFTSRNRNIEFIFRTNPEGKIFHTTQVELNGFIQSMLSGTAYEQKGYEYFGKRVYNELIADTICLPVRRMNIPARQVGAETGTQFMRRIDSLPLKEREEEIFLALSSGNVPDFVRNTVTLKASFSDAEDAIHSVEYDVMPDYLAVGSDDDYCRIPMNPGTAQRLADLFGASLLTAKLSDEIYRNADIKLSPFNYIPVGNANELVSKFVMHNDQIDKQFREAGGKEGQLVAGIKKDLILSSRIADRDDRVVIYGWHKPDGKPIQPVYSGHVWWYVDYSHGIRFINNQVIIDGKPADYREILKDPLLFRIFSNEEVPVKQPFYPVLVESGDSK